MLSHFAFLYTDSAAILFLYFGLDASSRTPDGAAARRLARDQLGP